ncbi:hypothetical protein [Melittangium boletus]|uniref:hypothetical protein n=1 Tax=Melittangium boletus TaxID=83453 RepID=UPI003DA6CB54
MRDTVRWNGGKLGLYHVGRRYRHLASRDRLHEGHNTETGTPAILMVPDKLDDWNQRLDWTVRIVSREAYPFIALEVEGAPSFDDLALQELTLRVYRMSGGLSLLEDRPDVRQHLLRQSVPVKTKTRTRRSLRMGATAATLVVCLSSFWSHRAETPEASLTHESVNYSDAEDTLLSAIGYAMPEKPFDEQKRPPCIPVTETELRGGCWVQMKHDAPCPPSSAEYEGHCYMPSKRKTPKPNVIGP